MERTDQQPPQPSPAQPQPWPDGVIARYLTVGGATVDLTHGNRTTPTDDGIGENRTHTSAICTGCPEAEEFSHWQTVKGMYSERKVRDPEVADAAARKWAQSHAETCRALPRPAVS
jgi:hypothetical protein